MNQVIEAFAWLADPTRWSGPSGIPVRLLEHLWHTLLGVGIAAVIAIPVGLLVGHTRRGRGPVVALSGAARALPTLGLVTLFGLWFGIGLTAPILAFVVLAVPSLLAGAYSACEAVDPRTVDAARAQGMTEWQILTRVEVPLGLPLLISGVRLASVQVVATVMLASYIGNGGLGRFIFLGLNLSDYPQMLGGSILVVALALVIDLALRLVERLAAPRGAARA